MKAVAECAYETARAAWSHVRDLLGWEALSTAAARQEVTLRRVRPGERYGRHLLLSPDAWQRLTSLAHRLVEMKLAPDPGVRGMEVLTTGREPAREGRTGIARCPSGEHRRGDQRPSLVLWPARDSHGGRGACVCMACGARGSWRPGEASDILVTLSGMGAEQAAESRWSPPSAPAYDPEPERIVADPQQIEPPRRQRPVSEHALSVLRTSCTDGRWRRWRTQGRSDDRGVIQALIAADKRSRQGAIKARAEAAALASGPDAPGDYLLPVPLISLDRVEASGWIPVDLGPTPRYRPAGWRPVDREWLVLDLDAVEGLDVAGEQRACEAVLEGLQRCVGLELEDVAIVRTGPSGLHVWARLQQATAPGFRELRELHRKASRAVLGSLRRIGVEGKSDPTAAHAGRWARRPSWRVLPSGEAFRSRLLLAIEGGQKIFIDNARFV